MTCPRMWKCNVYTFNHVLSHRSPPPRIRNYVSSPLSILLFLSLLFFSSSFRVTTTSTLNYASILIWLGLQTPSILFSRGEGATVLLCHVRESIKMDARRFLAMAMSAARGMLGAVAGRARTYSTASERRTCKFRTGYASIFTSGMTR